MKSADHMQWNKDIFQDIALNFKVQMTYVQMHCSCAVLVYFCPLLVLYAIIVIIDIDECSEDLHSCSGICKNIDGSYTCSCALGFILTTDGRTCEGIGYHLKFVQQLK